MESPVISKSENGVLTLTLNSLSNQNALSEVMMSALQMALDNAKSNDDIRVIILSANGPTFCAGHDLKELTAARNNADRGKAYFEEIMTDCSQLMQTIVTHSRPVLADVRGIATAAGCQLVASCDLAIAREDAKFSTPGVHIGLFCSTPMVALSRNISRKHAMEMLLSGEMIDAKRAEQIGLVNRIETAENMEEAVAALAAKIAAKSRMTIATGKAAFYQQAEMPLSGAYEYATRVMVENMLQADASEGINAFIEKRDPEWSDH